MFMGVPYLPFFMGAGGGFLLGVYFGLQYLLLIPVVIFVMRQMARRDEMIFRLLGLKWQIRLRVRNVRERGGHWVLSANNYREPGRK